MPTWTAIALALVLLAANAFFVGAEFSVMSARRSQIEPLAEAGSRRAATVLRAMERVSEMLACAQLGVTVASTGLGALAEPALARLIAPALAAAGLGHGAAHAVAAVLALVAVVYLHVVLGELVPKNLAMAGPDRAALLFVPPLTALARAVRPLVAALNWVANALVRAAGAQPRAEVASAFTAEEVASIVEHSQAEGVLADPEGLLSGSIEFSDLDAGQVMVPIAEVVAIPAGATPEEVEREVARTGFSRFPVGGQDGRLVGYLHVMDILSARGPERDAPVDPRLVRELAAVPPGTEVEGVLALMQRTGAHLAQVAPASGCAGGCAGVVFLEDILEELVGEVRDSMQRPRRDR
jgi:CBS domain containing-hemolysin-like protein